MKNLQYLLVAIVLTSLLSCQKPENPPEPHPLPTPPFETPATSDIIMYEVNMRAFSTSGDLAGVSRRLDVIAALGVNVIWLMPIHPIGEVNSVNSPYSVKNYKEISAEYGTLNDLREFVSQAHIRNMAVILDWVANHTAWDNPWIENKDWYTQDGNGNIIHPPGTNWLDVADLNYDSPEMREKMIEAMKYWVEVADIDGFRCDAADFVPYNFWQQAINALNDFTDKDLVLLAEGARQDHFSAGFDMSFGWDSYQKTKDLFEGNISVQALFNAHQSEYNNVPDGKHILRFTTNHDESAWDATPMILFNGKKGALAASAMTIFLGGVPLIYNGQEVGVEENIPFFSNQPINWDQNHDMFEDYAIMLTYYKFSDVARHGELMTFPDPSTVAFMKTLDQDTLFVIANSGNEALMFEIPDELQSRTWENIVSGSTIFVGDQLELGPYEYFILD